AGFDPESPILPNQRWSFTIDKARDWSYHDHLSPQYTATVVVRTGLDIFPKKEVPCDALSGTLKLNCFSRMLEMHLRDDGIESAFAYFKEIYTADPMVPASCHQWLHRLGEI